MIVVEYVLTYEVSSEDEIEEIENRLRATSPETMDALDRDHAPG